MGEKIQNEIDNLYDAHNCLVSSADALRTMHDAELTSDEHTQLEEIIWSFYDFRDIIDNIIERKERQLEELEILVDDAEKDS